MNPVQAASTAARSEAVRVTPRIAPRSGRWGFAPCADSAAPAISVIDAISPRHVTKTYIKSPGGRYAAPSTRAALESLRDQPRSAARRAPPGAREGRHHHGRRPDGGRGRLYGLPRLSRGRAGPGPAGNGRGLERARGGGPPDAGAAARERRAHLSPLRRAGGACRLHGLHHL